MIPIVVDMTVAESTQRFDMEVSESIHAFNMTVAAPFIVAPIPSNYGRIDWNGSIITVS